MVNRFHFRGHPEYVEAAARRSGRPELAGPAGRTEALAALSTLCAQAMAVDGPRAAEILRNAAVFRDQLRVASRAAQLMIRDVERACPAGRPGPSGPIGAGEPNPSWTGASDRHPSQPSRKPISNP